MRREYKEIRDSIFCYFSGRFYEHAVDWRGHALRWKMQQAAAVFGNHVEYICASFETIFVFAPN